MTELPLSLCVAVPAPESGARRFRDPAFARRVEQWERRLSPWLADIDPVEAPAQLWPAICARLPFPIFVKPANLGSSVGISKAHNAEELASALEARESAFELHANGSRFFSRTRSTLPAFRTPLR